MATVARRGDLGEDRTCRAAVNLGNAAAFLLVAVLAGAVLWRGHYPFWVRVGLVLLALLGMVLILLSGMGVL